MLIQLKNKKGIITKVSFFDDIDYAPVENYFHFQKNMLLSNSVDGKYKDIVSEVGSLMNDVKTEDRNLLQKRLTNLYQRVIYSVNNFSYELLACCCLLEKQEKFDNDSLTQACNFLKNAGITNADITFITEHVKKKYKNNDSEEVFKLIAQYLT